MGIEGHETADQMARLGPECPFTGPELACGISAGIAKTRQDCQGLDKQKPHKILGVLNRPQTCKGFPTRTLCQKI
jgi:hypothetical protein